MSNSFHDKVVQLIPSKSLRDKIKETDYHFSDLSLLAIIFNCSKNFDSRIALLKYFQSNTTGEIKDYAERIVQTQLQMRDAFISNDSGSVYELHIKETPDAYDETYLCSSFEAAIKMISLFYKEYETEETSLVRYKIVKQRVFSVSDGEAFAEDELGEAVLLAGNILYSVEMYGYNAEKCDDSCCDCTQLCIRSHDIEFPCFTEDKDIVEYIESNGSRKFGINCQWDNEPGSECYIYPMDSEQIRYHDFENVFYSHEHIPAPLVEIIDPETLPPKAKEDYFAFLKFLEETPDSIGY